MNRRLLITIATAVILFVGTYIAIQFAKGYRPDLKTKEIKGTGLLVVNSQPKGAQVFLNEKLTTATDDTLNLPPGEYVVEIKKDGYITWKKNLLIEEELVTQGNARLFPAVTSLKPLTFTGAKNVLPSPDGQKIVYSVIESSEEANKGLWILDLAERPLSLSKDARQIVRNTPNLDFSRAILNWSPDASQILAHFPDNDEEKTPLKSTEANILLNSQEFNRVENLRDVSAQLPVIFSQWEEQITLKQNDQLANLPLAMQEIATDSASNLYFSPDENKIIYTATAEAVIPEKLIPPLPATNTQPEDRHLKPGNSYVYDLQEDKNFLILEGKPKSSETASKINLVSAIIQKSLFPFESSPSAYNKLQRAEITDTIQAFRNQYTPLTLQKIQWFPDSKHLILTEDKKITILEYDGTNHAVVYSGKPEDSFSYPWPDGSKLLILTSLNPESNSIPNIYAVNLE